MKRDPFYEEDFLSEQIGKEEMNRKMKLKNFAKEKRDMYKEYVNKKEMEAQKKKEKYKSQVQCDNNKVDKTQRKWYLNSDIFNMKPLPQKEETQNIITNDNNESNIKLSKEEYLQFKEYLNEQERNKQQILEQYTQCKQNKNNDNDKHKSSNIINTNQQTRNEMSQTPDYEYLQQYSNSLKQQNDMQTQNQNIKQLLNQTKHEYLNNKHKGISTYENLTHSITIHPSLKTKPNYVKYINPDKLNEINSKRAKQKQYKQLLDQQTHYNKHHNTSNSNIYKHPTPSNIQNNPLIQF